MMQSPLVAVENLVVEFKGRSLKQPNRVVKGVSFEIHEGQTLGLVGESGSGKTTIGRALLGLTAESSGSIRFDGRELTELARSERRRASAGIQAVFQDPYSSLNPSMTIADILAEPITEGKGKQKRERVEELLDAVGLPSGSGRRLAREFSGGQRQRIAIARALALRPKLIICDEPTSALDMSTQSRVLKLLRDLQEQTSVAYLFISHDLRVVQAMSEHTAVLLGGEIVELGSADQVAEAPEHPYTRRLQLATPVPDPARQRQRREERIRFLQEQAAAGEEVR